MKNPCPIPDCSGELASKRFDGMGLVLGCTGPEAHTDATIRNWLIREGDTDDESDAMLMRLDPVEFIRDQVRHATERKGGGIKSPPKSMLVRPPSYPTGLRGVQNGRLLHYRGMTILSGKASSGKTWSALRASLDAACDGWHVHYLAAEGAAVAHTRAGELAHGDTPKRWTLQVIEDGSQIGDLAQYITDAICSERTLIVLDSISTVLRMLDDDSGDPWSMQRQVERFLFNLRQFTAGCVSPLVISEANAAGETKGRSFDHIADLSVNFRADEDEAEIKHVKVMKSWWDRVGDVGRFRVAVNQGGLVRMPDDGASVQEQNEPAYAVGGI